MQPQYCIFSKELGKFKNVKNASKVKNFYKIHKTDNPWIFEYAIFYNGFE